MNCPRPRRAYSAVACIAIWLFLCNGLAIASALASAPPLPVKAPPAPTGAQTLTPVGQAWAPEEVADALRQCRALLKGAAARYSLLPPIRQGRCGTPAPVLLHSIGKRPVVTLSPAATVNCAMVPALIRLSTQGLQPLGAKHLQSAVVRITVLSSYACRTRYGRKGTRLSEHALANAIDIGAFEFANGRIVRLIGDWGPTRRDAAVLPQASGDVRGKRPAITRAEPNLTPLPVRRPASPGPQRFLRELHTIGCRIFGTVLGPEANEAHRDHFHFDLHPRRKHSYCR